MTCAEFLAPTCRGGLVLAAGTVTGLALWSVASAFGLSAPPALLGTVLYRAAARDDIRVRRLALVVLAGNETWNAVFFGRRSTRDGFLGLLLFLPPPAALQRAARTDPTSAALLAPYTTVVLAYDLPWA